MLSNIRKHAKLDAANLLARRNSGGEATCSAVSNEDTVLPLADVCLRRIPNKRVCVVQRKMAVFLIGFVLSLLLLLLCFGCGGELQSGHKHDQPNRPVHHLQVAVSTHHHQHSIYAELAQQCPHDAIPSPVVPPIHSSDRS